MIQSSVYLIDDHPVVALGLKIALARSSDLVLVGTDHDPDLGLHRLVAAQPHSLVLDLVYAGEVRFSLIEKARRHLPDTALIVFTSLPERLYLRDALAAGADAYLEKDADMAVLVRLIKSLVTSRPSVANTFSANSRPTSTDSLMIDGVHLSRREMEIAALVGRGLLPARIAELIDISPRTVAAHRENIRRKLNCRNSKELVARLARLDAARG